MSDDTAHTSIKVDAEAWRAHRAEAELEGRTASEHLSVVLRERHGVDPDDE